MTDEEIIEQQNAHYMAGYPSRRSEKKMTPDEIKNRISFALKETLERQQSCTYFKLQKAKEIITALLPFEHVIDPYAITSDFEENKRRFHEPFRKAEEFLREIEE